VCAGKLSKYQELEISNRLQRVNPAGSLRARGEGEGAEEEKAQSKGVGTRSDSPERATSPRK